MDALTQILFVDIETVSQNESFDHLSERFQTLWEHKAKYLADNTISPEQSYFERAAIYAEFGKVLVIGMGFFYYDADKNLCFKTKALYNADEKALLLDFQQLLETRFDPKQLRLCAHNGKEFDFPYLCRRYLANGLSLPAVLQLQQRKPWEVPHLDTLEMWKFGDKKSFTSLELLAAVFNIPTSKEGIDGSKVNETYYRQQNIEAIASYCQRDVVVLARIYLRLTGHADVKNEHIYSL